ncbi:hypothetical protein COO60DRAFT_1273727 [Scenedesmus sp. NREL 46B-D3]|nr:hypothetical protein COO60DRAFT_1273727 [Scenedesmus sp. NREL 46B-D3]
MQDAVRSLLLGIGEDVHRQGLLDTPKRVAKALIAMTEGYRQDSGRLLSQALFDEPIIEAGSGGLVLVRDIDFACLSQESLLPFYGRAHIAYVPVNGVVLGLSKLARLTKLCAKQLQSQDSLARHVLHALQTQLAPQGALVVVQARHLSYTALQPPAQQAAAAASGCLQENEQGSDLYCQQLLGCVSSSRCDELAGASTGAAAAVVDGSSSSSNSMETAMMLLLAEAGVDVVSPAVQAAVRRHVLALLAATAGYHQQLPAHLETSQLEEQQHCQWVEHHVPFTSQCEHHMLPFHGTVHVIYMLPHCRGSGSTQHQQRGALSEAEATRLVRCFTQRLQVQERITHQVAGAVQQLLQPLGVMVVISAAHMCMVARGVENHAGSTSTRAAFGLFEQDTQLRCKVLRKLSQQQQQQEAAA